MNIIVTRVAAGSAAALIAGGAMAGCNKNASPQASAAAASAKAELHGPNGAKAKKIVTDCLARSTGLKSFRTCVAPHATSPAARHVLYSCVLKAWFGSKAKRDDALALCILANR